MSPENKNFEIVLVGKISFMQIKLRKKISQMTGTDWSEIMEGLYYANENIALLACPHLGMELIKLFLIEAHLC